MPSSEDPYEEDVTLKVDDSGRVTIPKRIRDRLGIEPNDTISATFVGSVLAINPAQSSKLDPATAGRTDEDWHESTPMDAGRALVGSLGEDDT